MQMPQRAIDVFIACLIASGGVAVKPQRVEIAANM
jgi:hypothetical protein